MMKRAKRALKPYSKAIQTGYRAFRRRTAAAVPEWARPRAERALDYFDLVFVDHGIFRGLYANAHQVAPGVWRSSQPGPGQIRNWAKRGIRTIINLRGERDCGSYRLEVEACRKYGITLIDFQLHSRAVPTPRKVCEAHDLLKSVEYPVLLHCKSGADRAGLMSVLVVYFNQGRPMEKALKQLSLKFGHIRQSDTGVLDHFFERYIAHNRKQPIPFVEWLHRVYDPKTVHSEFKARGWANLIVNRALRRE
jgi:protein tyrosine/serine phosphatase